MRSPRRAITLVAVTAAAVLVPVRADAHLVTTGLGPIYDGIGHFVVSPDDVIPVIAMALLAGATGAAVARVALFTITASWLLGGIAGATVGTNAVPASLAAISFMVLGGLTASGWRLPRAAAASLAAAVGLAHGYLNGASILEAGREPLGIAGITCAIFVSVALVASLSVSARSAWTRIAVRVAGSWVAAIGLLMLGWNLRGQ